MVGGARGAIDQPLTLTMATNRPRKSFAVIFVTLTVVLAVLAGLYTLFTLTWAYSEGERSGYLQKLSKKGWLCKTWEGEILLSSMPGAIPERFAFTVRDEEVVKQLQSAMGQRVQISYDQHKGIPTTCFGETEYFVKKVDVGGQPPFAPSAM